MQLLEVTSALQNTFLFLYHFHFIDGGNTLSNIRNAHKTSFLNTLKQQIMKVQLSQFLKIFIVNVQAVTVKYAKNPLIHLSIN